MATQMLSLSQPFGNRSAVLHTLARQKAIKAIKQELQAKGLRLSYIPVRDIRAFANAYLAEHRTELIEQAMETVRLVNKSVTVRTGGRAVSMENSRLRDAAPTSVNVTVGKRSREYLTDREAERLIEAAKPNRSGHRDATAILVAYRHGLRASELVALRWDDIDLATGRLHVRRAKSGDASVHPISARESRALRKLLREAPPSPYVFISERRAPLSAAGYQRMVARAGVAAKFTFLVHSHMLRHACGFKLANDGHDTRAIQAYLGHRSIMSTVRYTALTPNRFKNVAPML